MLSFGRYVIQLLLKLACVRNSADSFSAVNVPRNFLLRGCEAIRVINWDEFLFFFFFFVMVVANCNESCYWLHVHCSQWQLLLFFPSGLNIAFVAIWTVSCGELRYCLTRCTNPELFAKCEHILCMTSGLNERAAKPKFVAQS